MADIAMLVAEDYERRIKITNRYYSTKPREEQEQGAGLEIIDTASSASGYARKETGEEKMVEAVSKWAFSGLEPNSPVGFAACNGFFSA